MAALSDAGLVWSGLARALISAQLPLPANSATTSSGVFFFFDERRGKKVGHVNVARKPRHHHLRAAPASLDQTAESGDAISLPL